MIVASSSDDENEEQEIIFDPVELEPVFETVDWNSNQSAVEYALNLCSHQPVKASQLLSQIFLFNFNMQDCDETSVLKSQAVALGKLIDASLTPANIIELEKRAGTHQRKEFIRRKLIASNVVKFEHRMKIVLPQCIALHQTLPLALPQYHALSWKILGIVFKRFEKISKENVSQTVGLIPSYLGTIIITFIVIVLTPFAPQHVSMKRLRGPTAVTKCCLTALRRSYKSLNRFG